ncbi:hypothetical protein I553_7402 [Mycobacterium xenopi 4042]|uniref:Uncharacterized protein n=1 Tax=Mycobacterium xenopi 4042 TaxID=1299334 RepID=X8E840_MYCXE|nr:hypothetical protein I553_7402 [Mycobacterium xenopi 4042]
MANVTASVHHRFTIAMFNWLVPGHLLTGADQMGSARRRAAFPAA